MNRIFLLFLVVSAVLACGKAPGPGANAAKPASDAAPAAIAEARHDEAWVCNCGPDCTCGTVKTAAGTCTCGKELVWTHLVKVEGTDALLCQCEKGCACAIDTADPTRCECGKELRRVSLKGTGLYFCNCGGSCTCNHLSREPGTCACGMALTST